MYYTLGCDVATSASKSVRTVRKNEIHKCGNFDLGLFPHYVRPSGGDPPGAFDFFTTYFPSRVPMETVHVFVFVLGPSPGPDHPSRAESSYFSPDVRGKQVSSILDRNSEFQDFSPLGKWTAA